jgi:hypothetical protein
VKIRSIKPGFFKHDEVSQVSRPARLTWIGLWCFCDDAGRGRYNARLIHSELYALDDETSIEDVQDDLDELERLGHLVRYDADGQKLFYIPRFEKHQKPKYKTVNYPGPIEPPSNPNRGAIEPLSNPGLSLVFPEDSTKVGQAGTDQEVVFPESSLGVVVGLGDVVGVGVGTAPRRETPVDNSSGFETFYDAYPRKRDRQSALKAWNAAMKRGADPAVVVEAAERYAAERHGQDPKFTKHPATWLNAGAYDNEAEAALSRAVGDYQPWANPADPSAYDEDLL